MKKQENKFDIITSTFIALFVYNILYWPSRYLGDYIPSFLHGFYPAIREYWWLFILFEILAIASLFVDVIVRWDQFTTLSKRIRLVLTSVFTVAFLSRLIFGYMELYLKGELAK
jgi:hypothetical protein